ncbi:MAG: signal peptidase II, partial [Candidatus Limnocylindrales bacterium]
VLSLIIVAVLLRATADLTRESRLAAIGVPIVIGGAIGNLLDRIRHGYVIDWVDMGIGSWRFYTFNVADSAISIAIVLLLVSAVIGRSDAAEDGR